MAEDAAMEETTVPVDAAQELRTLRVTNIAPAVSREQMKNLFTFIGKISDFKLYPEGSSNMMQTQVCYVKFEKIDDAGVGRHLNNLVFVDRALNVSLAESDDIPDEATALAYATAANTNMAASMPDGGLGLMGGMINPALLGDDPAKGLEDAMKKVKDAHSLIAKVISSPGETAAAPAVAARPPPPRRRSRSRSPRKHSSSRRRSRSRSRGRREEGRSHSSKRRSRSRERGSKHRRSRSPGRKHRRSRSGSRGKHRRSDDKTRKRSRSPRARKEKNGANGGGGAGSDVEMSS